MRYNRLTTDRANAGSWAHDSMQACTCHAIETGSASAYLTACDIILVADSLALPSSKRLKVLRAFKVAH